MNPSSLFVLASASPARRRLLQMVGIDAIAHPSNFDESLVQSNDPGELVKTLAEQKAATSMQSLWEQRGELQLAGVGRLFSRTPGVILGCDSVLAREKFTANQQTQKQRSLGGN
jgi:septum formation protein